MKNKKYLNHPSLFNCKICVVGLGYVGLPLAIEFSKVKKSIKTGVELDRKVIGLDLNKKRIDELNNGIDSTMEIEENDLKNLKKIEFTSDVKSAISSDVFIIAVPTPINKKKEPDLDFLRGATEAVGDILACRLNETLPVIIFESTVYPGTTEEICVPILEEKSGLKYNKDFCCGYSPERINPGDKEHRLTSIVKVTSGSNNITSSWINELYGSIIKAGTYEAKSIKVAEAAKVIENTQRDINIALINEIAKICKKINIDTLDVLNAAESKWNFLPFRPGLVGGHCISVDPYYLTYIAKKNGLYPEIVLAGRNLNDGMSNWIIDQIFLEARNKKIDIKNARFLIMGVTFKENCPDTRNSKAFEIINILNKQEILPFIYDPYIKELDKDKETKFSVLKELPKVKEERFDIILVIVSHKEFLLIKKVMWKKLLKENNIIFDLKGIVPRELNPLRI